MWSSLRAWSVSDAHTAPPTVARPAFLLLCRTLNSSTHLAVFAECHAPRLSVFCPSPFSRWPFLFWFPSCPEHTMATPLEDVGKQVGRSHPLPVAPKGLPGASRQLSFLVCLSPRCGGVPCSWPTIFSSNGTSSRAALCWSSGRARGWPASLQPPWHAPFTVQVGLPSQERALTVSESVNFGCC